MTKYKNKLKYNQEHINYYNKIINQIKNFEEETYTPKLLYTSKEFPYVKIRHELCNEIAAKEPGLYGSFFTIYEKKFYFLAAEFNTGYYLKRRQNKNISLFEEVETNRKNKEDDIKNK